MGGFWNKRLRWPLICEAYGDENPWIDEICEQTDSSSVLVNADLEQISTALDHCVEVRLYK